jgi:hypothetical protein
MEIEEERFEALSTEVHEVPVSQRDRSSIANAPNLPRCLRALVLARERFRKTLLVAAALLLVSIVELAVLFLMPQALPLVVWSEKQTRTLVTWP